MSAIVIHQQVQRRLAGELAGDAAQEPQKLLLPRRFRQAMAFIQELRWVMQIRMSECVLG